MAHLCTALASLSSPAFRRRSHWRTIATRLLTAAVACVTVAGAVPAPAADLPAMRVPDGIGVSIHFRDPKSSEMQALSAAGVRWLRTDLFWHVTEKQPGVYDFSLYDPLVTAATQNGMKLMLILCYTNPLYDNGQSPASPAGRAAFANWAKAAVARFQGRGYIWELYNEPNHTFWKPTTMTMAEKASAYAQLAAVVGPAIKSTYPNEILVGPSVAYFDGMNVNFNPTMSFLQTCLQQGVCAYFDGISVHPYRTVKPEYVFSDYNALRNRIQNTSINTTGRFPPIVSGEWGYTSRWYNGDEVNKARFLSRSILHNYHCGVPLSIVYDWSNGTNLQDPEQTFGLVAYYDRNLANPAITPLPAYRAVKTIYTQLGGYTYTGRITTTDTSDYILRFTKHGKNRYVAWNDAGKNNSVVVPAAPGVSVLVTSYDGQWSGAFNAGAGGGFTAVTNSAPQFIVAAGQ